MNKVDKIFTNSNFRESLNYLTEVNDIDSDAYDSTPKTDNLKSIIDNDLVDQVGAPKSNELITKILSRDGKKRYYMSKFRL